MYSSIPWHDSLDGGVVPINFFYYTISIAHTGMDGVLGNVTVCHVGTMHVCFHSLVLSSTDGLYVCIHGTYVYFTVE